MYVCVIDQISLLKFSAWYELVQYDFHMHHLTRCRLWAFSSRLIIRDKVIEYRLFASFGFAPLLNAQSLNTHLSAFYFLSRLVKEKNCKKQWEACDSNQNGQIHVCTYMWFTRSYRVVIRMCMLSLSIVRYKSSVSLESKEHKLFHTYCS